MVAENKRYLFRGSYNVNNKFAQKYTEQEIERIGQELIYFAQHNRAIHFIRFTIKYHKSRQWLCDMSKHYPKFAEYYQIARELMASKISDLCLYDKESGVNATFGQNNLYKYDDDLTDFIEWKASLKEEVSDTPQNIHLHLQSPPQHIVDAVSEEKASEK